METFILGEKSTQKQMFTEKGERIPVTHIITAPCYLLDVKEMQGKWSLLLGFGKCKKTSKPRQGILDKAGVKTPLRFFREWRLVETPELLNTETKKGIKINDSEIYVGDEIRSSLLFKPEVFVDVTGTSKGKGFAGVVKRHHFKGGPRTHGQSDRERAPGSIGQTTTPGRVYKGKRMAGRMGGETKTIKRLEVIQATDTEVVVKGLVPGSKGGLLIVSSK